MKHVIFLLAGFIILLGIISLLIGIKWLVAYFTGHDNALYVLSLVLFVLGVGAMCYGAGSAFLGDKFK